MSFQSVTKWWRDRQRRHEIRVFSAVKVDVSGTPPEPQNEDDPIATRMRELLGDKTFEGQQRLVNSETASKLC